MVHQKLSFCVLLLFIVIFAGCNKDKGIACKEEKISLPLEFAKWFQDFSKDYTSAEAFSEHALTEKFIFSRYENSNYGIGYGRVPGGCFEYFAEHKSLGYGSQLYARQISLRLTAKKDTIQLDITEQTQSLASAHRPRYSTLSFRMNDSSGISQTISHNNHQITYTPELDIVDSLVVFEKVYRKVFKVENTPMRTWGKNDDVLHIYFTAEHGLLRFDQVDSTVWQMKYN